MRVTLPSEAQDQITMGRRGDIDPWNKFAHRPDLDTADGEALIIADSTTNSVEVLTTGETFDIAYNSTTDGAGGGATGATVLAIWYLDGNGSMLFATHVLGSDGTDTTSFSGLGINRVAVASSGSNDTNVNDITITSTTTGGVHAFIPAGEGVTQQALFHTPSDCVNGAAKLLFGNALKLSGGASPRITFKGIVHNRNVDTKFEIFRYLLDTGVQNDFAITDPINFRLSPSDILYFVASTSVNDTSIGTIRFSLNVLYN